MIHERYYEFKARQDELIQRRNEKTDFYNGVYERYRYPLLAREYVPIHWRYDLDRESNPYFMERKAARVFPRAARE